MWTIKVTGVVQGVGFRPAVARTAVRTGTNGSVRNDGSPVTIMVNRDPEGFLQTRSKAPQTPRSQMVTVSLALDAQDPYRPGRGWGRRSTTTWSRMVAQWRQDYIDRWGFPPEEAGRVARDD